MIDFKSYQQVSLHDKGERVDGIRRSRDATDNDTTAESEFQSPIRANKFYYNDNNLSATAPRFGSVQAAASIDIPQSNRVRRLVPSVGGRLNISNIPVLDSSGSDRSSPNVSTPSDEEKESSPRNDSRRRHGEWSTYSTVRLQLLNFIFLRG